MSGGPERILAIDLDGTLLDSDGRIAEADRLAVARARRLGYEPVIATGRFPGGALSAAREIECTLPLICADGALLVESGSPPRLVRSAPLRRLADVVALCERHALRPFLLNHEAWYCRPRDRLLAGYVSGWAEGASERRFDEASEIVLVLGVGCAIAARTAARAAEPLEREHVVADAFPLSSWLWAARFRPSGASKGAALLELASRFGLGRDAIAAVGNDYNDLSLFGVAGQSFAMGDAPLTVRHAASHRLQRTAREGGGIAEAVERLIALDRAGSGSEGVSVGAEIVEREQRRVFAGEPEHRQ
jgi:hydroxymethylpyrimidine pyrophosphatase-like HAD family hydrolase